MKISNYFKTGEGRHKIWIIIGILLIASFIITTACYQTIPAPRPVAAPLPTPAPRQAFQASAPAVSSQGEKAEADLQTRNALLDFARSHANLERDWGAFRKSYMDWQQKTAQNDTLVYKGLNDFLARFVAVKREVNQLQAPAGASEVVEKLIQAVDREDTAMRDLRDNWAGGSFDSFQKYDKERQEVNKIRRQAAAILQELSSPSASRDRTPTSLETATPAFTPGRTRTVDPQALQQLERGVQSVNRTWNDFQSSYDAWRSLDYSSEREASYVQLAAFVSGFRSLLSQISNQPAPGQLRPIAELMTQAAEKEEAAIRSLRDNVRPYDSRLYQAYEKDWATIDRLRRQASASLTELLFKQGISPSEVK